MKNICLLTVDVGSKTTRRFAAIRWEPIFRAAIFQNVFHFPISIRIRPLMSCFLGNLLLLNVSNQVYSLELPGLNEALPLSTNGWVLHNNLDWERYFLLPNLNWQDFVNSRVILYKVAQFTQSYIALGVRNKLVRQI